MFGVSLALGIFLDFTRLRSYVVFNCLDIAAYQGMKQVIWWITSFTLGHSLTLGLTATAIISVESNWVELGISVTIFLTAAFHLIRNFSLSQAGPYLSLIFGAVHGLGFGSYYAFIAQMILFEAWLPFNIGIELGQILIVVILLFVYSISQKIGVQLQMLRALITGAVLTLSTLMILERIREWNFNSTI